MDYFDKVFLYGHSLLCVNVSSSDFILAAKSMIFLRIFEMTLMALFCLQFVG